MSYYVSRPSTRDEGELSWVGPLRTAKQAHKEATAWVSTGAYPVRVHESTPEVRKQVRDFQKRASNRRANSPYANSVAGGFR